MKRESSPRQGSEGGRLFRVSAIVLRHRPLGDNDQILTLLTRERGKMAAVAKGIRRPQSRLAAGLQPFTHSRLLLAWGQNLPLVTQCQILHSFYSLRLDLERLAYATYFCELADSFLEEGQRSPAFDLLLWGLSGLAGGKQGALLARALELRMAAALGYRPRLEACCLCQAHPGQGLSLAFSPSAGGLVCTSCQTEVADAIPFSYGAIRAARALMEGNPWLADRLRLSPSILEQLEAALRPFLEFHLDRRLRSARFLREWTKG